MLCLRLRKIYLSQGNEDMNRSWCIWAGSPQPELRVLIPSVVILAATSTITSPLAMYGVPHLWGVDTANIYWPEVNLEILPRHPEYTIFWLFKMSFYYELIQCLRNKNQILRSLWHAIKQTTLWCGQLLWWRKRMIDYLGNMFELVPHPISPFRWRIRPRAIPLNLICPWISNLNKFVPIYFSYLEKKN